MMLKKLHKSTWTPAVASGAAVLVPSAAHAATWVPTATGTCSWNVTSNWDAGLSGKWVNGDFDYNGVINADDLFLIHRNYTRQTLGTYPSAPAVGLSGVSAVPETARLSVLGVAAVGLIGQRRRC